jgi:hypothetical protein
VNLVRLDRQSHIDQEQHASKDDRAERIHNLITKIDRTEQEEKQLRYVQSIEQTVSSYVIIVRRYLKLEDEFERRFGRLHYSSMEIYKPIVCFRWA